MPADLDANVGHPPLTALDWIGAIVAGAAVVGLALFPVSGFRSMFRDLGSAADLPFLTRVALVPGFPLMLALPGVVSLAVGLRARAPRRARRICIAAAFAVGSVGVVFCLIAMYLPIFSIAGKIKAD